MDDNTLSKHNGKFFTVLDQTELGKGSYGEIYLCKNEYGKKLAIKCCQLDDYGIPNILEASIMKTINHSTLNHALEVICSSSRLYIIQDLAMTDLHQYTSKYKSNHKCTIEELNYIYSSLLQAVSILHDQNIIHCYIKASNVLMYNDHSIKLADFTLATFKSPELYKHTVCTSSHRSLECFLKEGFDEKLDIWSLGCTFYEIAHQELLFTNQGLLEKLSKKTVKKILNEKSINAILDWGIHTNQVISMKHYNVPYTPIHVHIHDDLLINDIINKMLMLNPVDRSNTIDLLHEYYPNKYKNASFITNVKINLEYTEQARIIRYIEQMSKDLNVQKLAYDMYTRLSISNISEYYRAIGCTFIAIKLYTGSQPLLNIIEVIPMDQLLQIEKDICHDLHFRLHI